MSLNGGSKPPRDFPAGGKNSVAWKLFHYLTPQEWHKAAKEKSESSTHVSTTGNSFSFLGGGRSNVGEFNLFPDIYLFFCLFTQHQEMSKNGNDLDPFCFIQRNICPWQSYYFFPLLFAV